MLRKNGLGTVLLIFIGAFMLLNGISVLTSSTKGIGGFMHDISRTFGGKGNVLAIGIAIGQIIAGALLILSQFLSLGHLDKILILIVSIFWAVVVLFSHFTGGSIKGIDTLPWWIGLTNHGIILTALWTVRR